MNMFNSVPLKSPKRSTFDLSHDKRLTCQMGLLYPILVQETLPSDTFRGGTDVLVRLAPLLAPIFEQVHVYIHYFFVPNRLLWEEWETFITGGQYGVTETIVPPVPPQFNVEDVLGEDPTQFSKSQLADYLGVPILGDLPNAPDPVNWANAWLDGMPFMAYQKIWYDYYRDRKFVDDTVLDLSVIAPTGMPFPSGEMDGTEIQSWIANYMTLRPRCYKHDYFTSANPDAQLGDQVMIPSTSFNYLSVSKVIRSDTGLPAAGPLTVQIAGAGNLVDSGSVVGDRIENLESAGALVNDFRTAYALQVWLEKNAIGGSRYTESLQIHFDVKPQDSRLQRAEYIGGGFVHVKISEVVATAWSENEAAASVPQGNMAGHGVTFSSDNNFRYFCPEHGFIMGILSIVNPPSYHQGLPRMFRRTDFLSYPWPTFAKLGEQEVYAYELYAASVNWNSQDPATWPVFGYQSRYAEWKFGKNTNHGDFHDTLLFWTLTSDYGITPTLDADFTMFDPNIEDRIFAAPTANNFWIYLHNRITAQRPLPYFGTPNRLGFE